MRHNSFAPSRALLLACTAPAVAFFAAFWLLPIVQLIALPASKGWETYFVVLTHPRYLQSLLQTLGLSLAVTLATLVLGAAVGITLARHRFTGRQLLLSLLTLPLSFPGVIIGFFMILLGGRQGLVADLTDAPRLMGLLAFGDELKPTAAHAVRQLKALGIRTVLVTGDNQGSAQAVGRALGLDHIRAEVLPADKAGIVADLRRGGDRVAMVGDGINDAPALAAADVGMAMSTGTDVAMHAAGITLMRGDPALVADAIDISRRTYRKIRQNLFWAFAYNVIGIPLAAAGLLNPVLAGAAMALSSVSVVGNALLLRRWQR